MATPPPPKGITARQLNRLSRPDQAIWRSTEADLQRALAGVKKDAPDKCWLWQGRPTTSGYARMSIGGVQVPVHRLIAHHLVHPLSASPTMSEPKANVHHKCEVRACCNPDHLEVLPPAAHHRRHAT